MPGCWMAGVLGMIKNGDADGFFIYRPGIIAPISSFAPGLVVLLPLGIAHHGEVARHRQPARAEQWIEIDMGRALEMILGEKLPIDFDAELVRQLRDLDPFAFALRREGGSCHESTGQNPCRK